MEDATVARGVDGSRCGGIALSSSEGIRVCCFKKAIRGMDSDFPSLEA